MLTKARMRGLVGGAAILTLFGGFWCIAALAFWPTRPAWGIPVASAATFVLLLFCILRWMASARMPESHDPAAAAKGRRAGIIFGIVFGLEAGLIALSSTLLARSGLGEWIPLEVGFIVGVHFLPLAYLFEVPLYYWSGGLTVIGIVGCLFIPTSSARLLCAGLVMAGALWLTTLLLLVQTRKSANLRRHPVVVNPESQQKQKKIGRPRKFSDEFRAQALERMKTCDNVTALARELGIRRKFLYHWRDQALGRVPQSGSRLKAKPAVGERELKRIAELERLVAPQALEIDFFKGALQRVGGTAPEARTDFRRGVYEQIRQVDGQQGELTVERMCTLAAVSRASYYRHLGPQPANDEEDSRLRDAMQRIALANRHYGYRPITHALRAQGWEINHKRVARLMRLDNLLAIRKRRFAPVTTDSKHDLEVSIDVARRLTPTAINQLWVADITYVRLGRIDVFLAVVLDAFSPKVIGWKVAPTLAATLPLDGHWQPSQAIGHVLDRTRRPRHRRDGIT